MRIVHLSLSFFVFVLSNCIQYGAWGARPLPAPHGITEASGAEQARCDIAVGKLQLLEAGTRGVYTPGVPFGVARFDHIPRHKLPVGCTTPDAGKWVEYAEGYNAVVLAHLKLGR